MSYSFPKEKIKVLLLENISPTALKEFEDNGYTNIECLKSALGEEELIEKIKDVHIIGIRSATKITEKVIASAKKLLCIGCFCIGTNQVDLVNAKKAGIAVFNAPFSNTRSVAELVIGEAIMLMRGVFDKSMNAHNGVWKKSAVNSREVRGKNLGIVGYGHIGSQVSVLAESLGMNVYYYDTAKKLHIGNAKSCTSLKELLSISDIVTLHVPATPKTKNLMSKEMIEGMKEGSYLINASRGNVVDIPALKVALDSGKILGAALDVFPKEPKSNKDEFISELRGLTQVIMTPHVGGSTLEAQENIGVEVAEKLIKYSDNGSTEGSVNIPEVHLPENDTKHRILHLHKNIPGTLSAINKVFSSKNYNICAQYLQTDPEVGYVVIDIDPAKDIKETLEELKEIEGTIKTRMIY